MAADDLQLIHLDHLFPAVAAIRHTGHVALVWMDHLTEVAWADRHLECEAFGKHSVRFDKARAHDALSVTIPVPIERILEQVQTTIFNPSFR